MQAPAEQAQDEARCQEGLSTTASNSSTSIDTVETGVEAVAVQADATNGF